MKITGVSVKGKCLIITGEGFDKNARVLINGKKQKTKNDKANPSSVLVAKKAVKNITPGQRVSIRVLNLDDTLSNEIIFMRPVE